MADNRVQIVIQADAGGARAVIDELNRRLRDTGSAVTEGGAAAGAGVKAIEGGAAGAKAAVDNLGRGMQAMGSRPAGRPPAE